MIHIKKYTGYSDEDCIRKINNDIDDSKIINVIPSGKKNFMDDDGYDTWTECYMRVIYRD